MGAAPYCQGDPSIPKGALDSRHHCAAERWPLDASDSSYQQPRSPPLQLPAAPWGRRKGLHGQVRLSGCGWSRWPRPLCGVPGFETFSQTTHQCSSSTRTVLKDSPSESPLPPDSVTLRASRDLPALWPRPEPARCRCCGVKSQKTCGRPAVQKAAHPLWCCGVPTRLQAAVPAPRGC